MWVSWGFCTIYEAYILVHPLFLSFMDVKSVSLSPCFPLYYRALESAADWNVQDTDGTYEWLIIGDVVHNQPVTTQRCVKC